MSWSKGDDFYRCLPLLRDIGIPPNKTSKIFVINIIDIPIHIHETVELLYVLRGNIDVKISFNQYSLKPGDFLLINQFEIHSLTPETDDTVMLAMHIRQEEFQEGLFIFDPSFYNTQASDDVKLIKNLMIELYLQNFSQNNDEKRSLTEQIVQICDNSFQMQKFNPTYRKQTGYKDDSVQIQRLKHAYSYLYSHQENPRLESFAKKEHIDKHYASRLIKDGLGLGFNKINNIVKIDRSELYLLGTDYSIQDIYREVGFSSYDYFNEQFKNYFGVTASEYRKKYKPLSYPYKNMIFNKLNLGESQLRSYRDTMSEYRREHSNLNEQTKEETLEKHLVAIEKSITPQKELTHTIGKKRYTFTVEEE